jgi:hypothetical protein
MGKDGQPKARQFARELRRRAAVRQPIDRLLIVCEGSKTEPNYLDEIRQELRLSTAHVQVRPSGFGTDPLSVVDYAEHLFRHGDRAAGIEAREFDAVFLVFDRDDHESYHEALAKVAHLNRRLPNDEKSPVPFEHAVSVPCFELWLLLHFEDVHAPIHRDEVYERLKTHHPGYDKGQCGLWPSTKSMLAIATDRAEVRAAATTAAGGVETYTGMHKLVARLIALKNPP